MTNRTRACGERRQGLLEVDQVRRPRALEGFRQLNPPVPIRGPHHHDVDSNTFEPVDAVHPRALDRRLAFFRHAERGEKSDGVGEVFDDDADVIQSLDRHVTASSAAFAAVC
jgi:hypothetical protein